MLVAQPLLCKDIPARDKTRHVFLGVFPKSLGCRHVRLIAPSAETKIALCRNTPRTTSDSKRPARFSVDTTPTPEQATLHTGTQSQAAQCLWSSASILLTTFLLAPGAAHASLDTQLRDLDVAAAQEPTHLSFVSLLLLACCGYWLIKAVSYFLSEQDDDASNQDSKGGWLPRGRGEKKQAADDMSAHSKAPIRTFIDAKAGGDPQDARNKSLAKSAVYSVASVVREGQPRIHALLLAEVTARRQLQQQRQLQRQGGLEKPPPPSGAPRSVHVSSTLSHSTQGQGRGVDASDVSDACAAPSTITLPQTAHISGAEQAPCTQSSTSSPTSSSSSSSRRAGGGSGSEGLQLTALQPVHQAAELQRSDPAVDPVAALVAAKVEQLVRQAPAVADWWDHPSQVAAVERSLLEELAQQAAARELARLRGMAACGKLRVDGKPCALTGGAAVEGNDKRTPPPASDGRTPKS